MANIKRTRTLAASAENTGAVIKAVVILISGHRTVRNLAIISAEKTFID
jgi:hypothetical protein